ncbi:ankyrin repeat-containing domain protein [Xylaria acuta]|nr:ankyrin repeat-containing domain protein [Xylaria acuta]
MNACRNGDSNKVKQLLKSRDASPNEMTPSNDTPLSIAIKGGFEEVVQLLLWEGADPNLCCGKGETSPLQVGVALGMPNIVRMLAQHGADPNYISARRWSLPHYMFDSTNLVPGTEYFMIFWDSLVFDEIKDSEGWTALHRCAAFGTGECVYNLHLLGASAWSDRYLTNWGGTPVHIAAMMNNVSTLEGLMTLQIDLKAAQEVSRGCISALDPTDVHGWTPLHLAAYRGAIDTMRWLLQRGADPHRRTFQTASWFPDGHEGETFNASSLASMSGTACLDVFLETLRDMGCDVARRGDEIYWPA